MKVGLVLGLDGVGKTLLLRQLTAQLMRKQKSVCSRLKALGPTLGFTGNKLDQSSEYNTIEGETHLSVNSHTQPSVGVEHWKFSLENGKTCLLREVGGQLLPMWSCYFDSCHFWLFLVDASNGTHLAAAAIEFFALLNVDEMRQKPKLLVINHIDAEFVVDDTMIQTYFCLDRLFLEPDNGPTQIVKISAQTGENVDQILKWLGQTTTSGLFSGNSPSVTTLGGSRNRTGSQQNDMRVHPIEE